MDEFLHKLVFLEDLSDTAKFKQLTEILLNCIITAESAKDDKKLKTKMLEKVHPDNLLVRFFENIEEQRLELLQPSFEALKYLYDFLSNKSAFFEKDFPTILVTYLGSPDTWHEKDHNALIVLTKMLNDPSLLKKFKELDLPVNLLKHLKLHVLTDTPSIKNPDTIFEPISPISQDPKTRSLQLMTHALGDLSKYDA